jgi:hypothetical protein
MRLFVASCCLLPSCAQVVISIVACIQHVLSTYKENDYYRDHDDGADVPVTTFDTWNELILSSLFLIDLLVHLYTTDNRITFWVQNDTIVDVLTLFPVAISLAGTSVAINTAFLRALRMLR